MPMKKPPVAPPLEEFTDDGFRLVHATMRGTRYTLQELPADVYEKCLEGSLDEDGNSDNVKLLKLMLDKSLTEPKMTVAELWKLPYPVIRKLNDIINDIHFSYVQTDEEQKETDDGEGKAAA
jgi:hypothetical protein